MIEPAIDLDELLRIFLAEAEENLAAMEESLVALESAPDDSELIATIFRAAHTLKGNCASLGLQAPVAIAHAAEDLLNELRSRRLRATPALITILLRGADALKTLIPRAAAHPDDSALVADSALIEALRHAAATGKGVAAGPAAQPVQETTAAGQHISSLRVATGKLDQLLDVVSELSVTRGRVRQLGLAREPELDDALDRLDQLTDRIQDLVLQTRMVPIGPVLHQHVRIARDLAAHVGKQVTVEIAGEDVELDTSVIEKLRDPLTHMVRNAIDHGIEDPAVRRQCGKPDRATIALRAAHRHGMMIVEVADDGRGLDPARLRERAQSSGLATENLSDEDVLRLVLLPGFSTATQITEISGRGIGLDVVEKNVSAIGGAIAIASSPGRGTTFTIRLPLTVAVLHGLSARVGPELYIVPLPAVVECLDMPGPAAQSTADSGVFTLRGEPVPFLRLRDRFRSPGRPAANEKLIVVDDARSRAALVVDELVGETRAVVKPMPRLFRRSGWISGSALLGNGEIGLVLEVASLLSDLSGRSAKHGEI